MFQGQIWPGYEVQQKRHRRDFCSEVCYVHQERGQVRRQGRAALLIGGTNQHSLFRCI